MQEALRKKFKASGVSFVDATTVYLSEDTVIGRGVTIEPFVIIGKGVVIEDNAVIKGFCHIEDAFIKQGASIGPFARVRGGSEIGVHAHVGNFVEVKNATLSQEAKAAHLSYIGDSSVGARTNIGAGVITCNYDGFNKFHTTIGADAFIGSNSALVAPVEVADGGFVAAGSVITKPVGKDDMAVTRAEQKNYPDGAARYRAKRQKSQI